MNQQDSQAIILKVLTALKQHDSWCGETHLQKAMYCLEALTHVSTGFSFTLYKHGPYSFGLHDELAVLLVDGFVVLRMNPQPYGPSLVVSEQGQHLLMDNAATMKLTEDLDRRIQFIAQQFGGKGVAELERLTTALYVTHEQPNTSATERESRLRGLKPHIDENRAQSAVREVDELISAVRARFS